MPSDIESTFVEKLITKYVDLWKPYNFKSATGLYPAQRSLIELSMSDRLRILLSIDNFLGTRPEYFNIDVEFDLLDMPQATNTQYHMAAYFESQIYFILAKYSFIRNRNLYSKEQIQKDIADFYDATNSSVAETFLYTIDWFDQYKKDKVNFINAADVFVRTNYSTVVDLLGKYSDFDGVDDIFMLLSIKGNVSLKRIFGLNLASPSDDALIFDANDIINDAQFKNKRFSSYAVFNGLRSVSKINIDSFYNFYSNDESIAGIGDNVANTINYYDLASIYKYMPRYNKLTWHPISGGKGINTVIVPVSGNISNISELPISNEFYAAQTFRKQSNNYLTINSESEEKFERSLPWSKILSGLINKETKDVIDNKIFVVDHELLRKRTDDQPRLQYVGYIIHKYVFINEWKLKEIIILDDCSTSTYYDFNVLYNRKYKYKIAVLLKWVYSTSLIETEPFYSTATYIDELAITAIPEVTIPIPGTLPTQPPLESVSANGLSVMGSAAQFEGRTGEIIGGITREEENTRMATADSSLSSVINSVGMTISSVLNSKSR